MFCVSRQPCIPEQAYFKRVTAGSSIALFGKVDALGDRGVVVEEYLDEFGGIRLGEIRSGEFSHEGNKGLLIARRLKCKEVCIPLKLSREGIRDGQS